MKEFGSNRELFKNMLAYPYEYYKYGSDFDKPIEELQSIGKEAFYSKFDDTYPDQEERGNSWN